MISVIVPTLNEAENIKDTVETALRGPHVDEVIVVDGGSHDETVKIAESSGAKISLSPPGRPIQMNVGVKTAKSPILYFLHADTRPPDGFDSEILEAFGRGYKMGSFQLSFNHPHWLFKLYSYFTKFSASCFRFGDQSLFVTRSLFNKVGGFDEERLILEDQDIIRRLTKETPLALMNKKVVTSARRYLEHGILKTQVKYFLIFLKYWKGARPSESYSQYRSLFQR